MKVLVVLSSLFVFSNGLLLELLNQIAGNGGANCKNSSSFKDPMIGIDPVCEGKADTGDCSFYDCFEDRYPCGKCGFPKTYDLYNCEKMHMPLYTDKFDQAGKQFMNDAGICLTQHMRTLYRLERVSCEVVKHQMEEKISDCFITSGFCDMLMANRNALWSVYNVKKIIKSPKVVGEVMDIARNCSEQIAAWAFGPAHTGITQKQTSISSGLSQLITALGKK